MDDGLKPDIEVSLPPLYGLRLDAGRLSLTFLNLPLSDVELIQSPDGKLITMHVHNVTKHFPNLMYKWIMWIQSVTGQIGAKP